VRPSVPAALTTRVFAPLFERLEGRLRQHDPLSVTTSGDNSHGELVAVPVMRGTLAVDAKEERSALGEWLVCGSGSTGYVSIDRRCEGNRTPEKLEQPQSNVST